MDLELFEECYRFAKNEEERRQLVVDVFKKKSYSKADETFARQVVVAQRRHLNALRNYFKQNFPNFDDLWKERISYEDFAALWRLLQEYPELCQGMEKEFLTLFADLFQKNTFNRLFRRQLSEMSVLFPREVIVDYFLKNPEESQEYVRWLMSELFDIRIESNINMMRKALVLAAEGKELSNAQEALLAMCRD